MKSKQQFFLIMYSTKELGNWVLGVKNKLDHFERCYYYKVITRKTEFGPNDLKICLSSAKRLGYTIEPYKHLNLGTYFDTRKQIPFIARRCL